MERLFWVSRENGVKDTVSGNKISTFLNKSTWSYCKIVTSNKPSQMKISEIFKEIVHRIGFDERSPFVLLQIDETNMRIAIPITIYTLVVERFMYNRTVLLWGLVTKKMYNLCFTVLAVCSVQLLVIAMLYLAGKLRKAKVARASMLIFNIACFTAGQIIAVYAYAIGKQVFIFLPMVSWIFALMIMIRPCSFFSRMKLQASSSSAMPMSPRLRL